MLTKVKELNLTKEQMVKIRYAIKLLADLSDEQWNELFEILETVDEDSVKERDAEMSDKISRLLYDLKVPPNHKGHKYLVIAILYVIKAKKNDTKLITKGMYTNIAEQSNITKEYVLRVIGREVNALWNRDGNRELLREIFKGKKFPTTPRKFIITVAEYLNNN